MFDRTQIELEVLQFEHARKSWITHPPAPHVMLAALGEMIETLKRFREAELCDRDEAEPDADERAELQIKALLETLGNVMKLGRDRRYIAMSEVRRVINRGIEEYGNI